METEAAAKPLVNVRDGIVEVAGSEEFVKQVYEEWKDRIQSAFAKAPTPVDVGDVQQSSSASAYDHSTNTIATKLAATTGADLVMAAVAHIVLVQGKERFSRKNLNDEMKAATSFYKQTYTNNLSSYIDRLLKADRLRLMGNDAFGLSATEKTKLEAALAE